MNKENLPQSLEDSKKSKIRLLSDEEERIGEII